MLAYHAEDYRFDYQHHKEKIEAEENFTSSLSFSLIV
jgi:hypothetical protein